MNAVAKITDTRATASPRGETKLREVAYERVERECDHRRGQEQEQDVTERSGEEKREEQEHGKDMGIFVERPVIEPVDIPAAPPPAQPCRSLPHPEHCCKARRVFAFLTNPIVSL